MMRGMEGTNGEVVRIMVQEHVSYATAQIIL